MTSAHHTSYAEPVTDLVLITGASRGLGAALAGTVPFSARVFDISRSGPGDVDIDHIRADLSDPSDWGRVGEELRRLVAELQPRRAVMIHNAGTLTPIGFAGEVDAGAYRDNVILNGAAGQVMGHHFLSAVADHDGDFDLVMITSGAASKTYPGWSAYGAGKAALDQWVRIVGDEQRTRGGVIVSAIAPGVLDTAMQEEIRDSSMKDFPDIERFSDLHEKGRLVDPDDAARRIWDMIEAGIENGAVFDIRTG